MNCHHTLPVIYHADLDPVRLPGSQYHALPADCDVQGARKARAVWVEVGGEWTKKTIVGEGREAVWQSDTSVRIGMGGRMERQWVKGGWLRRKEWE